MRRAEEGQVAMVIGNGRAEDRYADSKETDKSISPHPSVRYQLKL